MPGLPLTCSPQEPGISTIYNDIEPFCCQWLRNLIDAGHLPAGEVIEGDFREIAADDIPETAHFFAGIGGWSYALELAGWQGPVWTASLPCQPLSSAGQRRGHNDERHLWPAFHALVAKRRPATIFGEQVASKDGREWFAGIRADLEALGYACGAADLPAASVGARQIRARLFFVAKLNIARCKNGCGGLGYETKQNVRAVAARASMQDGLEQAKALSVPDESWCVDGLSANVAAVRAYGNAIVPQVAAEFVRAFMECR